MTEYGVSAALGRFGVTPDSIEPITSGGVNAHWLVRAGDRWFVLRRYNPRHDPAGTAYEHEALAFAAQRGWPVAPPLPARDGLLVVECERRRYSLFPFLQGSSAPARDLEDVHQKGAILARLHRDLIGWRVNGQRPGFGRVSDLDTYLAPDRFASLQALLDWTARSDAPMAGTVRRERAANLEELHTLGFAQLPLVPVHFEFYGANLLFEGRALSGVLDWDFVHLDARISDIGRSVVIDCAAGDGGIDATLYEAFLGGYQEESPLGGAEVALLPAVLRANLLWLVALPLSLWASGDPAPYLLPSARHTATVQLPRLRAQAEALTAVARLVASRRRP